MKTGEYLENFSEHLKIIYRSYQRTAVVLQVWISEKRHHFFIIVVPQISPLWRNSWLRYWSILNILPDISGASRCTEVGARWWTLWHPITSQPGQTHQRPQGRGRRAQRHRSRQWDVVIAATALALCPLRSTLRALMCLSWLRRERECPQCIIQQKYLTWPWTSRTAPFDASDHIVTASRGWDGHDVPRDDEWQTAKPYQYAMTALLAESSTMGPQNHGDESIVIS